MVIFFWLGKATPRISSPVPGNTLGGDAEYSGCWEDRSLAVGSWWFQISEFLGEKSSGLVILNDLKALKQGPVNISATDGNIRCADQETSGVQTSGVLAQASLWGAWGLGVGSNRWAGKLTQQTSTFTWYLGATPLCFPISVCGRICQLFLNIHFHDSLNNKPQYFEHALPEQRLLSPAFLGNWYGQGAKLWIVADRFLKEEVSRSNSGKYYSSKARR